MKRILIVYHSQERGNTRRMAELVAKGCREVPDVEVEMINVNEQRVDMNVAEQADAYALGSPDYFTYMAGGLKTFFDDLCLADWAGKSVKAKPYVAFVTHGGGGDAIKSIHDLAEAMELTRVAPSVICQWAPTGSAIERSVQLGRALAEYAVKMG
ncbi:MAG: NAD(P)H-dependent oxidoreductase [Armatimonadetes bacterium]|nr:NAD(P)H-dependent oxidoreductase [Armatimonadota bacterium]